MPNCYICGTENANQSLSLKDSFTAHTRCKCPNSKNLCRRCFDCIDGQYKQCWYYHPTKEKWSKLWGRNWSWLVCSDADKNRPTFHLSPHDDGLLEVKNLPTRSEIREWLLNPPNPPFTICIAESGQKHTYPFSIESISKNLFPVLFEETLIYLDRQQFAGVLKIFESLMRLGFSKTEISSGDYRSDKIAKCLSDFFLLENQIAAYRGTDLLRLADFVGAMLD